MINGFKRLIIVPCFHDANRSPGKDEFLLRSIAFVSNDFNPKKIRYNAPATLMAPNKYGFEAMIADNPKAVNTAYTSIPQPRPIAPDIAGLIPFDNDFVMTKTTDDPGVIFTTRTVKTKSLKS